MSTRPMFLKLKFNPEFDYLDQLVFVQRFPLLGRSLSAQPLAGRLLERQWPPQQLNRPYRPLEQLLELQQRARRHLQQLPLAVRELARPRPPLVRLLRQLRL